ncbi:hypothetical protein, partial [Mycobacterium sp.]|uniref:hypothetical protein n=1 Tax=Mycobacterium sp. TaxID=1785 RepID=UPI0025F03960
MVCTRFFSRQTQLLVELKTGLAEDGDDPSARSDIGQLLRPLRLRHDVTYRIRNEIDQVLASIESAETTDAQARPHEPKTAEAEPTPATQSSPSPQRVSGPAPSAPDVPAAGDGGGASTKRLVGVGGAVLAA